VRRPAVIELLAKLGLDRFATRLAPYATVELALIPDPDGKSRLGGQPDLPPYLPWPVRSWPLAEVPTWPDWVQAQVADARDKLQVYDLDDSLLAPIPFLLQLDLADVDDPRLPGRGHLCFFAGVTSDILDNRDAKRVACAVIHVEAGGVPRKRPPTIDEPPPRVARFRVEPAICWDIPYEDQVALERDIGADAYRTMLADASALRHAVFPAPADECNGPMPPSGEVSLLRLHEDDDAGFVVGDASWLTFTLPAAGLSDARASVFIG